MPARRCRRRAPAARGRPRRGGRRRPAPARRARFRHPGDPDGGSAGRPGPPSRRSSTGGACGSTASAGARPGTPWSRPGSGWATASCTAAPRCSAATTWPSSSSVSARWASTPAGSTASSATRPRWRSATSSATPACRSTASSGPTTLRELLRVQARHQQARPVSTVRDRERLRQAPPTLAGRHVAVGEAGGLGTRGRRPPPAPGHGRGPGHLLHHPDGSAQAHQANAAGADVYLGLRLDPVRPGCQRAYYSGYRYESPAAAGWPSSCTRRVPVALGVADRWCARHVGAGAPGDPHAGGHRRGRPGGGRGRARSRPGRRAGQRAQSTGRGAAWD